MLRQGVCRHFTGIVSKVCEAGIPYAQFHGQVYPCFRPQPTDAREQAMCAQHSLPSAEEAAADEARIDAEVRAYLAAYEAHQSRGECGICGTSMTAKVQVGRCVYVEPCGCRLGQGQRMKDGRRVRRLEIATN